MVPVIAAGRSFKGAALYFLHDKRQEGEALRTTTERIAWAQPVNLPTNDPERAWRMMATTALKADELKAGAGVKKTGNKLQKAVAHYSLSWHPSEKPTQAEQMEAAQETLKLLGLSEYQAIIVSHNDEDHAHIHVVVNRVHPTDGKAAQLSNSKRILSKWAEDYEKRRGQVFCPQRVANNARRKAGEAVHSPRVARPVHEFRQATGQRPTAAMIQAEQRTQDAQLAQAGRDMHQAHAKQWAALKLAYSQAKGRLYRDADKRTEDRTAEVKADFKPEWGALFRQERAEQRSFQARERSLIGRVWNMAATAREIRRQGEEVPGGILGMAFAVFSRGERENALAAGHRGRRMDLAGRVSQATRAERQQIRRQTKKAADTLRDTFLKQCAELKAEQDRQRAALKDQWRARNEARKTAYAAIPSREQLMAKVRAQQPANQLTPGMARARRRGPGLG
ncbi:hypothetical protein APZ41_018760 [Roseomonas mucosa]|uniref:MobA/VirD2-like nuclease domain-containing protein n=1 Tax=Roseomonas mucosa TaxID=207340 RepID=A0A1S8D1C8_9PROT|nr:relaxase/mobilization nuclease domain-containing protein [Roseomonas mucosa]ONH81647.1 hypothetical protein APZ41_018760 [Roseomonas mucosa]